MSKVAFIFPGQGSQSVGMCKDLYENYACARRTFEEADEALGFSISKLCFEGPEDQLRLTFNTQPAILTASVACARVLAENGVTCEIAAGHSLGEYSALVQAEALDFADAVRIVRKRGQFMQEAVPVGEGSMAAVLGMDSDKIVEICRSVEAECGEAVQAVNFNCPGQVVIAGAVGAVDKALVALKEAGAKRAVLLPVSAPFHSTLLQPASDRLAEVFKTITFHDAKIPVMANVNAEEVTKAEVIKESLIRQAAMPVLWETGVRKMIAGGVDTFVEVGPGKVLCGFNKKIDKSVTSLNVEDEASLAKTLAYFQAENGADVAVNFAGSTAAAEAVAAEIEKMGRKAILVQGDVSQTEVCAEMVDKVVKELGRIDILVNNAGITRDTLLLRMKEEDWDAVLNTNLKGVFNCTKAAVKYMAKQRSGAIVNISSVVALMGNAGQANYAAAKAGILGFTRSVAKEMAARGIRVNAVTPGFIKTDMTSVLSEKVVAAMEASIPLARLGEPEDIAKAVLFLVSDNAAYITGQTLHVDGGMVM